MDERAEVVGDVLISGLYLGHESKCEQRMAGFFISYNEADRAWAEWIGWQLEEAGYTVIVQAWDFRPGGNFVLDMDSAAAESERTIAVLSRDYLDSRFVAPEWAAAFAQDPTGERGLLLPVRVRECEPAGLLPQIVYIDLVGLDEPTATERLLAGVNRERAKPTSAPRFPGAAPTVRTIVDRPRFPGALPPIWNVPHARNRLFTGREGLLSQIAAALQSGQPAALTQTLSGLGGVGKTQLAMEYAYRQVADYTLVWWLRAEEPTTLAAEFARLADVLDLPEKDVAEQSVVIEAARRWLERNGGWLLIFDNATEPQAVQPYRPRSDSGHVLITSRSQGWRGMAQPLSVEELPREEAIEFLLRRTGQDDAEAAANLADALGDLPLALEQAGAYIDAMSISLAEYLRLFESYQVPLLDEALPIDYPLSITKTWELAFQQVQQQLPAAADLLNLCAFLAPDNIPLAIIRDGAEHLPEPLASAVQNPLALNRAIGALLRYSLVERQDGMLSVHRMVQAVTRARLDDEGRKLWAGAAVEVVNAAFPFESEDVRTWDKCARLVEHALSATKYTESTNPNEWDDSIVHLLNKIGGYLFGRADFVGALNVFDRLLLIGEQIYDSAHEDFAAIINNKAAVLYHLGELELAREMYVQILIMVERTNGHFHQNVAICLYNLGDVLQDLGDLLTAKSMFEQALEINEKTFGLEHQDVAYGLNSLSSVLQELGESSVAKTMIERALMINEQMYGLDHPMVAMNVNVLGNILRDLGDLAGARAAYQRALHVLRQVLGDDHPKTRLVQNNLDALIQEQHEQSGE